MEIGQKGSEDQVKSGYLFKIHLVNHVTFSLLSPELEKSSELSICKVFRPQKIGKRQFKTLDCTNYPR